MQMGRPETQYRVKFGHHGQIFSKVPRSGTPRCVVVRPSESLYGRIDESLYSVVCVDVHCRPSTSVFQSTMVAVSSPLYHADFGLAEEIGKLPGGSICTCHGTTNKTVMTEQRGRTYHVHLERRTTVPAESFLAEPVHAAVVRNDLHK